MKARNLLLVSFAGVAAVTLVVTANPGDYLRIRWALNPNLPDTEVER